MDWTTILTTLAVSGGSIFAGIKAAPFVGEGEIGVLLSMNKAKRLPDGSVKLYPPGFKRIFPFVQKLRKLYLGNRVLNFPNFSCSMKGGLSYTFSGYIIYRAKLEPAAVEYLMFGIDDIRETVTVAFENTVQAILWKKDKESLNPGKALNTKIKELLSKDIAPHYIEIVDCGVSNFIETPISQTLVGVDYRIAKAMEYAGKVPDCLLMAAIGATPVVDPGACPPTMPTEALEETVNQ